MEGYIAIGTILNGRYEITEKIGSGGMAHVYKAHCHVLNRNVAIKVLRDEYIGDETFSRRFITEAQAAAALSHGNIMSVFDVCSEGRLHYIVMELIEGITLKEYIDANGPLPWETAVNFELQICAALECAHKNGVIHQDIKPHNILLTPEGVLKVTDFGIAHVANASTIVAGEADGVFGSVHYCSPEQARGGYTDAKTDIYSAGVVLYEMLTGRVPFDAQTPVAVALMHMQEDAIAPTVLNPDIPRDLEMVVWNAMRREKHYRYPSATDMIRDLNYVLEGIRVYPVGAQEEETPRRRKSADKDKKKKKKPEEKGGKGDFWIVLGSVFCALLLIGGVFGLYLSTGGQFNEVKVPKVVELPRDDAEMLLEESKLKMQIEEIVYDTKYESGVIVAQVPIEGKTVQKGYTVKVTISGGSEALKVPNVVNMDAQDAIEELEEAGFKVNHRSQYSADLPKDVVVRQTPAGGSDGVKGDTVIIYVNDRGNDTAVPSVIGMTTASARQLLEEKGFVIGNISEEKSAAPSGTVIRQVPAADADAAPGSSISLVVSAGVLEGGTTANPQTPTDENAVVSGGIETGTKTVTLSVPQEKAETQIRVLANGKEIHNALHHRSEVNFNVQVSGKGTVVLEILHDGAPKSVMNIKM